MASKRNRSRLRSRDTRANAAVDARSHESAFPWLALIAWTPLLARWLTPTEGTSLGDTLWLSTLTFLAAIAIAWHRARSGGSFRFDRIDVAVCLFCGAHVISALCVVATEGHKRAATNMLWEWTAIAVQFLLVRSTLTGPLRTAFLRVFVSLWIAQAGFGVWQHFVWYPSNIEQYEQQRDELDTLESGGSGLSGIDLEFRLRELRTRFVEQGVPLSGPARAQFEGRLKDSADPVGFFALTNTFAGFLAMLIVLLWATALAAWRSKPTLLFTGALMGVAVGCLLLTKSRTAMCGAVAGLVIATLIQQLQTRSGAQLRRALIAGIAIPLTAGALLATIVFSGGIDSDVLSDAPKSMQYRLQYWLATTRVIADHPLLGTGPGNFRNAYLQHKLPESSEEIADPHNFVLDVTANAGVVGLAAIVALLVLVTMSFVRTIGTQSGPSDKDESSRVSPRFVPLTIGAAALVVTGWKWLIEAHFDLMIPTVCATAAILACLLETRVEQFRTVPLAGIAGSAAGLLVHLLGAGGIAMPAVTGAMLAFFAMLAPRSPSVTDTVRSSRDGQKPLGLAVVVVTTFAFAGCAWTAFLPVLETTASLQRGDYEVVSRGNAEAARQAYEAATEHDSLSPDPFLRLAALKHQEFMAHRDERHLRESLTFLEQALARSPLSASIRRETGQRYLDLGEATQPGDPLSPDVCFDSAVEWYGKALRLYPSNCLWTAEFADALSHAGKAEQAADVARRALELDDLNLEQEHYDRVLPDELRSQMNGLATHNTP